MGVKGLTLNYFSFFHTVTVTLSDHPLTTVLVNIYILYDITDQNHFCRAQFLIDDKTILQSSLS